METEPKLSPRLFDVNVKDMPTETVPRIMPWKIIELDSAYAGSWIVAGDVDGDGEVEILSARNVDQNDVHYTCSVIAYKLDGTLLWRWGQPEIGRNPLHHDVACQIYDWDGDGRNEVILAANESLVELDGATGQEWRRFPIPPAASDCLVFANLLGSSHPNAVLVKTRYSQIWAYSYSGKLLWTVENPGGFRIAHQPRPVDIDGDGKDEILAGYALLNPDGSLHWLLADIETYQLAQGHLDCARLFERGKTAAESRLAITCCGADRMGLVDGNGHWIWSLGGHHFESIDIGKVHPDIPGRQIIVDIDHQPRGKSPLWLLSAEGELLGQIIADRCRRHQLIDWFGNGIQSIVIGQERAIFDGMGNMVGFFELPGLAEPVKINVQVYAAELTGDSIPDLIFHTAPASSVYLFKNAKGRKIEGVELGSGKNFTLY
ncbi:hypothetical protein JXJ21_07625 [candidate division KSB1 bacterium]|nr:hypothetical protein [candidate division KSB1 bacterium]